MIQVPLRYDRTFSRKNVFFWISGTSSIRCRIQIGAAPEVSPVDVHLRYRGQGPAPYLVHCRPIDGSTFITAAAVVHPDLPLMELLLQQVPEDVALEMQRL